MCLGTKCIVLKSEERRLANVSDPKVSASAMAECVNIVLGVRATRPKHSWNKRPHTVGTCGNEGAGSAAKHENIRDWRWYHFTRPKTLKIVMEKEEKGINM